jgi:uncharacterized OB-fold protein
MIVSKNRQGPDSIGILFRTIKHNPQKSEIGMRVKSNIENTLKNNTLITTTKAFEI